MVIRIREGYGEGLDTVKRDFKEKAPIQENCLTFEEIRKLIFDAFTFIWSFIYIFVKSILAYYSTKPKSLRGKVCFVTGSGRGLGRGICIALAKEGAILACADINEETNKQTVEILAGMGAKAKAYTLNVANKEEVERVAKEVESDLGTVYLVVNNAAIVLPPPTYDENYIRATVNVNLLGPIWITDAFLPKMKESNEGHILNMSSLSAAYGVFCMHIYSMTKAALTNYGQGMRLNLWCEGYENIYITTLHPSFINTSADYTQGIKSRIKILEEDEVVQLAIDSVKYNKADVSTNPVMHFWLCIGRFLPLDIAKSTVKWLNPEVTVPTMKEYNNLPASDIIAKSSHVAVTKPLQD